MTESFLEKLKKSVLQGAHSSATKIEEAARTGKLHLNLMAEKRKLAREYTELGKEANLALLEDAIAGFPTRPGIADMQKNIDKYKKNISELEARLAAVQRKPKG